MTAVWSLDLPDSEKLVLLALADSANDEGHCWPGMKSLVRKCSKTDRTIQAAIKSLVDAGHLTRREVPGKGCNYTVHPRSDFAPETASPPKGTTQTPEAASGKPLGTVKSEAKASSCARTRFPKDWVLPAVSALPPKSRACAEQWTADSYETHGEAFESYWRSEGKMKTDWVGTWVNRVIDLHSKVLRDQKFGNAPTGTASSAKPLTLEELRNAIRYRHDNGDDEGAKEYERQIAARAPPPSNIARLVPNLRAAR